MDWTWGITALSLIGAWANAKQESWGFLLWIVANSTWCIIDFKLQIYSQSALMLAFTLISVWGYIHWKRKEVEKL